MTLKEVARLAGVSPSSVSRYLNGGPLSGSKSAVIRRVIEQTGYVPDQAAHTLRTGRLRQVGVIVPRIHSESVSQVTSGIAEVLSERGYLPVLGATGRDAAREARYLETMQAYHVAGIVLMAVSPAEERARAFRACSVPLVLTGQAVDGLWCVYHDDSGAMGALARAMLDRGRRRICYIGVDESDTAVGVERLRGAREALAAAGTDPGSMTVERAASFEWESGRDAMRRLLTVRPDADAVLCATDVIAHGALLALREAGRRVPEDVSVAGVGSDWADLLSVPPLTAARLDQIRCGREAASILLRLLDRKDEDDDGPRHIRLGYELVDRGSI